MFKFLLLAFLASSLFADIFVKEVYTHKVGDVTGLKKQNPKKRYSPLNVTVTTVERHSLMDGYETSSYTDYTLTLSPRKVKRTGGLYLGDLVRIQLKNGEPYNLEKKMYYYTVKTEIKIPKGALKKLLFP